jgi:hypothetical protein
MSAATTDRPSPIAPDVAPGGGDHLVHVPRRRLDHLLIAFGVVAALAFGVAGGLLQWGANFADDYVHDELAAQNVFFPDADSLREEGREDLLDRAGEQVTTGAEAEAYAGYIQGHLDDIAGGLTYAEIDDRGAAAAVEEARESGASQAEVDELQATADELRGQRDSLFRGETLRGLLLTSYAWATVGGIAALAAIGAFVAAAVMALLVIAGLVHLRRTRA